MPNRNRHRHSNHIDERRDWYERDMMDERSGYRGEGRPARPQHDSDFDTNQSLRGNTYEAERWGAGTNRRDSSRNYSTNYSRDYNREMPQDYASSPTESYGARNSYYGRGPKNFKRSDERIKEEICEMLTRHHDINASDVEVEVKDGEVTLSGTVSERRMKHMTEDIAERCFGVREVTNNIRIKKDDFDSSQPESEKPIGKKSSSAGTQNPSH